MYSIGPACSCRGCIALYRTAPLSSMNSLGILALLVAINTAEAVASQTAGGNNGALMHQQMVSDTRCVDGSEAGFYYAEATSRPDTLVIFLQGGGSCSDLDGCTAWIKNRRIVDMPRWVRGQMGVCEC